MNNQEILQNAFDIIINFERRLKNLESITGQDILMDKIDRLELTVRAQNCLKSQNIRTIGDLIKKSSRELLSEPNLGKKSLKEIKESLDKINLKLRNEKEIN
jgi:DNA-directed RNA polymerase subunit alpha